MDNEKNNKENKNSFMKILATFIVDKRYLLFLFFAIAIIFSLWAMRLVKVENELSAYLPKNSSTRIAMDIMDEEFVTYGSAKFMFANVSYDTAEKIKNDIENTKGVFEVELDRTKKHYNNGSALLTITFDNDENDPKTLQLLDELKNKYKQYDLYVSTTLGTQKADAMANEMKIIVVIVAIILVLVLLLTSTTFAEVIVLIITFLVAAILNKGTNVFLGTISYVSNSVTLILQLAMSLDYAIILCNQFKEYRETLPIREAVISAVSKSIVEISASSLTTIGGLFAMTLMQFRIGPDMGINLIKAVILAMFSAFFLMPGLLMLFGPLMEKTKHKLLIPKITGIAKIDYKLKKIMPVIFLIIVIVGFILQKQCHYIFGYSEIRTNVRNEMQIADDMIKNTFEKNNDIALVYPVGNYDKELRAVKKLEKYNEVEDITSLSSTEAKDGRFLTEKLNPREFSELSGVDYDLCRVLYSSYALNKEKYGNIVGGVSQYQVPLIDMFIFLHDQCEDGYLDLEDDKKEDIYDAYDKIIRARDQLEGKKYARMIVSTNLPVSGDDTYKFIDTLIQEVKLVYDIDEVYAAGDSSCEYDFKKVFAIDNKVVSIASILIVLLVLLLTFKSVGLPILLVMVIQGCIWINFAYPTLAHMDVFFMSYLVVSAIQMGANIDYAVVVSSRFMEDRKTMNPIDSIIDTMNFSFPTIITSAPIFILSGLFISLLSSDGCIAGIGDCIFRGTLISVICVIFVLPCLLLIGEVIINKTSFNIKPKFKEKNISSKMFVDGVIKGRVNGEINAKVTGMVSGDLNVKMISGSISEEEE